MIKLAGHPLQKAIKHDLKLVIRARFRCFQRWVYSTFLGWVSNESISVTTSKNLISNDESDSDLNVIFDHARAGLSNKLGETEMLAIDGSLSIPMAIVASNTSSQVASQKEKVMGICSVVQAIKPGTQPAYGAGAMSPENDAWEYFKKYEGKDFDLPKEADISVVKSPRNGEITKLREVNGQLRWQYIPKAGFIGKDRIEYKVRIGVESVRLVYFVNVTTKNLDQDEFSITDFCKANEWKISSFDPQIKSLISKNSQEAKTHRTPTPKSN